MRKELDDLEGVKLARQTDFGREDGSSGVETAAIEANLAARQTNSAVRGRPAGDDLAACSSGGNMET
jgi:hypothetical protein